MAAPPEIIQPQSLNDYLEIMSKTVFQSGMSWKVVENKWPGIQEAFQGFDVKTVANFHEKDLDDLTQDKRVIRNYKKLSAIISNAQRLLELEEAHGTFQEYLRSQDDFDATLKMIRKDFKFLGPFGIYYFLYAVGEEVIPHEEFEQRYK